MRNGWIEYDRKDNALGTATKAAVSGKTHVIYSINAGYTNAATVGLLTLKDGVTTILEIDFIGSDTFVFPDGIAISSGAATSCTLSASGTGGVLGSISIHGNTI